LDTSEFVIGQRWVSHSDAALGLGIVTDISGRRVTLGFPAADEERTYAIDNAAMIAIAGYFKYLDGDFASQDVVPYSKSR